MVAKLTFGKSTAVLDGLGNWSSNDAHLLTTLRTNYSATLYPPSPAAGGSIYAAQARAAARQLGGKLEWGDLGEDEPDRVY